MLDLKKDPKGAYNAWPEVSYQSENLLDQYMKWVDKLAVDHGIEESEDSHYHTYQEVYLGYSPETDRFVTGFDCWDDEGSYSCVIEFSVSGDTVATHSIKQDQGHTFYPHFFRNLKDDFPTICNIRLD